MGMASFDPARIWFVLVYAHVWRGVQHHIGDRLRSDRGTGVYEGRRERRTIGRAFAIASDPQGERTDREKFARLDK